MQKIIYAGTPEFAVPALEALLETGYDVIAVYTQPDRPAGRGRRLKPSPIKACAMSANVPVYQPESFKKPEEIQQFKELNADIMVVAAYGLILPPKILQAPRLGCLNIHASLLPRWRGAAPIQRAILAGDKKSGITIMQMNEGLDTGDMLAKQAINIKEGWTAGELHDALSQLGAALLLSTIPRLESGLKVEKQNESEACYAPKLIKAESVIDWAKDVTTLSREIRAFVPWPVSFTWLEQDMLRIWQAEIEDISSIESPGRILEHNKSGILVSCGTGVLKIEELQFSGKKRINSAQLRNSRDLTGKFFSKVCQDQAS